MTGDEYTKLRKALQDEADERVRALALLDGIYQLGYDEGYTDGEAMNAD